MEPDMELSLISTGKKQNKTAIYPPWGVTAITLPPRAKHPPDRKEGHMALLSTPRVGSRSQPY